MSDIVRINKLQLLILKFRVWSEWGYQRPKKHEEPWKERDYFSFYDLVCCMILLTPVSVGIAIAAHIIEAMM